LNLSAAVSLFLFVAVMTMWVRSYRRWDALPRNIPFKTATTLQVQSIKGRVFVVRFRIIATGRGSFGEFLDRDVRICAMDAEMLLHQQDSIDHLGFASGSRHGGESDNDQTLNGYWMNGVAVPYWFLALLAAIGSVPGVASLMARRRAAHRASNQLCPTCGYDLRATLGRCPECGAAPGPAPTATAANAIGTRSS
jgi:hypothetical protein